MFLLEVCVCVHSRVCVCVVVSTAFLLLEVCVCVRVSDPLRVIFRPVHSK